MGPCHGVRTNTISSVSLPYSHTVLTNGVPYYYSLLAINSNGNAESTEVSGTPAAAPANFVGSPGSTEGFEGNSTTFDTPQFSRTDSQSSIDIYNTSYAHSGTHGVRFSGTGTDYINFIQADLGAVEDSYKLSFWVKTPPTSSNYNLKTFFTASDSTTLDGVTTAGVLAWRDEGAPTLFFYDRIGGSNVTYSLAASTEYKFVLNMTRNAPSTVQIYNTGGTLLTTLTLTLPNVGARYFTWSNAGFVYYIDEVIYDSTNP